MAYFSNGSEGDIFHKQCDECLPWQPCPIILVQLEYNYDQLNEGNEQLQECLNYLVDADGICQMKQCIESISKNT